MWKTFKGLFSIALVELKNASIFAPLLERDNKFSNYFIKVC